MCPESLVQKTPRTRYSFSRTLLKIILWTIRIFFMSLTLFVALHQRDRTEWGRRITVASPSCLIQRTIMFKWWENTKTNTPILQMKLECKYEPRYVLVFFLHKGKIHSNPLNQSVFCLYLIRLSIRAFSFFVTVHIIIGMLIISDNNAWVFVTQRETGNLLWLWPRL